MRADSSLGQHRRMPVAGRRPSSRSEHAPMHPSTGRPSLPLDSWQAPFRPRPGPPQAPLPANATAPSGRTWRPAAKRMPRQSNARRQPSATTGNHFNGPMPANASNRAANSPRRRALRFCTGPNCPEHSPWRQPLRSGFRLADRPSATHAVGEADLDDAAEGIVGEGVVVHLPMHEGRVLVG